jgi:hypothetical protein
LVVIAFMQTKRAALVGICSLLMFPAGDAEEVSAQTKARVIAALPHYQPPAPQAGAADSSANSVGMPAPLSDDPLVHFPEFRIREKLIPTDEPDKWLTPRGLREKALREYRNSLTDLEWALNSWYIPLFGTSPQARANAAHESRRIAGELARFSTIAKAVERSDPKEAAKLRDAMDPARPPKD